MSHCRSCSKDREKAQVTGWQTLERWLSLEKGSNFASRRHLAIMHISDCHNFGEVVWLASLDVAKHSARPRPFSPWQKVIWPQMSILVRMRNPAVELPFGYSFSDFGTQPAHSMLQKRRFPSVYLCFPRILRRGKGEGRTWYASKEKREEK